MFCAVSFASFSISLSLFSASEVFSHGTHPTFVEPSYGAAIKGTLRIRVAHPGVALPYLYIRVLKLPSPGSALRKTIGSSFDDVTQNGEVAWEGLVPQTQDGYSAEIDAANWISGYYEVQVQFLGDTVDETYVQPFIYYSR